MSDKETPGLTKTEFTKETLDQQKKYVPENENNVSDKERKGPTKKN